MTLSVNERKRMAKEIGAMVEKQKLQFAIQELEFIKDDLNLCMNCTDFAIVNRIKQLKKRLGELNG